MTMNEESNCKKCGSDSVAYDDKGFDGGRDYFFACECGHEWSEEHCPDPEMEGDDDE
jgi:DNA-directed RNA polymerase subunit M/transcription elongation factor TFIIS